MSKAKLQDRAFFDEVIATMPAVVHGMRYVLLIASEEGGALQVSNVPPDGQAYYLQCALENMNAAKAEFFPGRDKH